MSSSKVKVNPFKVNPNAKVLPLPSELIEASPASTNVPFDKPASNGGHGTDDTLQVIRILEKHDIRCCLVGISALIFYGAARVRPDWEICVPTDLVDKAKDVLQSEPHSSHYSLIEPWPYPSTSLVHTYHRFQGGDTDHYFVLVPSRDVHMTLEPSNITQSLRGLPYPTLPVFIQSSLDMRAMVQLVDVVDGTNISEQWGEENLQLDGTNDVAWARDLIQRARDFDGGRLAHLVPFVPDMPHSRREMWRSAVRTKEDRLDWTKPRDIFITQYRLVDDPDSWKVLSDMY